MNITNMNWEQVAAYLSNDDRCVLPIGSTEQHAGLSLCVDYILSERVATEAAEPLGIPVFPGLPYGYTPYFMAYPGTVCLRIETYVQLVRDILDSLAAQGFKRIVIVNGHGGNAPAQSLLSEWMGAHSGVMVRFHNWWNAPLTWAKVKEIDPVASHASWMENFPWTRLTGVDYYPDRQKEMIDIARMRELTPDGVRELVGDGNYGGRYQRPDKDMLDIWRTGVEETRSVIAAEWP